MMHLCARPGCENAVKRACRKHCSAACAYAGRHTDRRCEQCGKPRHEGKRFCSRQCATDAQANSAPSPHSDAMRAKFRVMWAAGEKVAVIALELHVTPNVIVGLRRRMKLPARPSPLGIHRNPPKPKAPKERKEPVETTVKRMVRSAETKAHAVEETRTLPPLASLRIPLEQRQFAALGRRPPQPAPNVVQLRLPIAAPRACQYPLWGALHADDRPVFGRMASDPRPGSKPRFCGDPAAEKSSYCSVHRALAYRNAAEVAA